MLRFCKALLTMLNRGFFPIYFSKSSNTMLYINFSFGLVKFETSLKVSGSLKLAESFTVRDAILLSNALRRKGLWLCGSRECLE